MGKSLEPVLILGWTCCKEFSVATLGIGLRCCGATMLLVRDGLPKKVAVLLDFVQMRGGGGPCPNFLSTFHKLYILGQFGDGEGGGDPCPIFFGTLAFKKSGTSCPN